MLSSSCTTDDSRRVTLPLNEVKTHDDAVVHAVNN